MVQKNLLFSQANVWWKGLSTVIVTVLYGLFWYLLRPATGEHSWDGQFYNVFAVVMAVLGLVAIWNQSFVAHRFFRFVLSYCTLLFAGLTAIIFFSPPLFNSIANEDRFIEALSALLPFAAFLLLGYLSVSSFFARRRGEAWGWLFLSLLCFVVCMEEVSWLQRVFHIPTPDFVFDINRQRELNLHNIEGSIESNIAVGYNAFFGSAFVVLPVLFEFLARLKSKVAQKVVKGVGRFVPGMWMTLPFAAPLVFLAPVFQRDPILLAVQGLVMLTLLYQAFRYLRTQPFYAVAYVGMVTFMFFVQTSYFLYSHTLVRLWGPIEYMEFFIALGLFAYAFDKLGTRNFLKKP